MAAGLNSIGILTGAYNLCWHNSSFDSMLIIYTRKFYIHTYIGGGIGRLVADWIINGKSDMDITGMNIDRLHPYQVSICSKLFFQ